MLGPAASKMKTRGGARSIRKVIQLEKLGYEVTHRITYIFTSTMTYLPPLWDVAVNFFLHFLVQLVTTLYQSHIGVRRVKKITLFYAFSSLSSISLTKMADAAKRKLVEVFIDTDSESESHTSSEVATVSTEEVGVVSEGEEPRELGGVDSPEMSTEEGKDSTL